MDERQVAGLWCHEVLEHLDRFVDGTLGPAELEAVRSHCADCTNCAEFGSAYARLVSALRTSTTSALDEARLQRLQARIAQEAS